MVATLSPQASTDRLKQAVETEHGGIATFVQAVPVREKVGDAIVWDDTVFVFELKSSHTGAFRAYAWSSDCDPSRARR